MKKITSSVFFVILFAFVALQASAQTTFRLGYGGAFGIPLSGGMVQTPVGDFVFCGTNATFGALGDITKIDNAGTTIWSKSYGAGFFTQLTDIKNVSAANGGGFIATGGGTSGGGGAVLIRVDNSGVPIWAFRYQFPNGPGNASSEYANAVIETSDGGFLVGGAVDYFYDGTTTYDTTLCFGFKVNSTGNLQWNKLWKTPSTLAGAAADVNYDKGYINDVAETTDGYFFVGQVPDVTQATNSNGDKPTRALIIKTDKAAGTLSYIRTFGSGGTNSTGINSAITLTDGNILLGGFDNNNAIFVKITGTGATPTVLFNKKVAETSSFVPVPWVIRNVMQNSDGNYSSISMRIDPFNFSSPLSSAILKINAGTGAVMIKKNYPGLGPLGASILPKGGLAVGDQGYFALSTDTDTTGYCFAAWKTDNLGDMPHTATSCNPATPNPSTSAYTVTYTTPTLTEYTTLVGSSFVPTVANLSPVKNVYCLSVACIPPSAPTTVTATPNPVCAGVSTTITASGSGAGYGYNVYAAASGGSSLGTTPYTVTPGGTTTYYVETYTIANPSCVSTTRTAVTVTVTPIVTPTTGFSYTTPVCANGTNPAPIPVAGFTAGGTYSSTAGLTINSATGVITLSTSTPGTYTVTYSVAASGCNPAGSSTASITITPVVTPTTGFSYTTPVCANGTNPTPTPSGGFTSGGTYSSTAGLTINASTGVITLSTSTPGTYTVTYSVAASGCNPAGSSTASITINPTTTPGTSFSYTTPVCANAANPSPTPGGGFTAGGTYSSTAGLTINSATGVIDLTTTTPGTYTVTYSVAASGCQVAGSGTASITINPVTTPVTGFFYTTPVCANGTNPTPTPVGGFTSGGTYSSTAGLTINSGTGVIDLSTTTPGTYTVTYSVAATTCGPAGSSTTSITINPNTTPGTSFSYATPVCANGTNPSPTAGGGFTAGGTYSSTAGLTINSGTGMIDLSTSTPGTYTVTYSVAASGCQLAGSGTASITINPTTTPGTSFSYTSPVCANGIDPTPIPSGGFTTGGTYSSTAGLTIDPSTGVITLASSTPGTYTVTYSVAATGCAVAGSGTASITIDPTTTPGTSFSYTTPVCANGTDPVPAAGGGFTAGGTYSSAAGLTIDATTGVITLSSSTPGTYTVTYSVAASGCQVAGGGTANITINPTTTPVTGFSYTSPVCANGTDPVPTPVGGFTTGGVYSSTAGLTINASTGVITLASSTPGTYTVTYDVAATVCGPAGSSATSITINPGTTPGTSFSYTTPVCITGSNPSPDAGGGFTAGGTYSSTAGLTIDPTTGVIDLSTTTAGTYTVTYSVAASGCQVAGSGTASITINSSTTPVTGFSYTTPVCANGTNPVPSPVGGFTSGGTYASTAGLTINAATGVITLSSSTPGTYTVTYSVAATACGPAGSSTTSITITPAPAATAGSTSATVCSGAAINLTSSGGGTYSWSGPGGYTSTLQNPVITSASASAAGTYTVTVTTSGCSATATTTITVNALPTVNVTGTTTICSGGSTTLTATGASTYVWNTTATTASITVSPTINTTYTVTGTSAAGCSSTQTVNVVVTTPPVAAVTASAPTICAGQTTTLTASGGSPFLWSTGATTASITVNPSVDSTYTVTVGSGCTDTASILVTVNPTPTSLITGATTITLGTSTTLTASGGTGYVWAPPTGLSCTACPVTVATPTATTQYCVTATNASGCSDTSCVIVEVDIQCGELYVPTAFSPNGDGENDILYVMGNCIVDLDFAIFDRWGERVFETQDPTVGWNGIYLDKHLDAGVFVYYLKATVNGTAVSKHGNITLVK